MKKILVTFATRTGSTADVAETIGQTLSADGAVVDVKAVKSVTELKVYDAVVVGSAIRMGQWLPEAVEFVKKNQALLSKIPTAFFTVHLLNRDDSEASRLARQAYTAPVRQILAPQAQVFFDGKMDYARLSFIDRTIAKTVAKSTNSGEGDYRNWDVIRRWARELEPTLLK